MAEFETKDFGHDFLEVDKPDESTPKSDETEDEPVSSTTADEPPKETSPLIDFGGSEKMDEPVVEEMKDETPREDEKPATEDLHLGSPKELSSFPARWMKDHGIDQRVIDLIYWRCLKKTGVLFATCLFVLASLMCYTALSVITFFSMAVLTVALLYRVGMTVMGAIQKTGTENAFKHLLEKDTDIPKDKAAECAEQCTECINVAVRELKRLFLVEDIVDSIKFGVLLWVLSYVGACFSFLTLVIIAVVLIFTLPKIYEEHQDKIDECVCAAHTKVCELVDQVKSKLPTRFQSKEKSS